MAGYRCPEEAADPDHLQCPSLACVTTPDPDDAFCSALCRDDLDCPAGYGCEEVEPGTSACQPDD